MVLISS